MSGKVCKDNMIFPNSDTLQRIFSISAGGSAFFASGPTALLQGGAGRPEEMRTLSTASSRKMKAPANSSLPVRWRALRRGGRNQKSCQCRKENLSHRSGIEKSPTGCLIGRNGKNVSGAGSARNYSSTNFACMLYLSLIVLKSNCAASSAVPAASAAFMLTLRAMKTFP